MSTKKPIPSARNGPKKPLIVYKAAPEIAKSSKEVSIDQAPEPQVLTQRKQGENIYTFDIKIGEGTKEQMYKIVPAESPILLGNESGDVVNYGGAAGSGKKPGN